MTDSQGSRGGDFSPECSSVQQKSSNPESSCASVKSDCSMDPPLMFKRGDKQPDLSNTSPTVKAQNTADEVLQKLLPVVTATRLAELSNCGITDEGCAALASALRSNPSHLRKLYLSLNKQLGDSGVKLLSAELENPHCKLERLWLSYCDVTDEGCAALVSALRSNPSHLRELELFGNKLGYSGVKMLSDLKDDPHYKLEILWTDQH